MEHLDGINAVIFSILHSLSGALVSTNEAATSLQNHSILFRLAIIVGTNYLLLNDMRDVMGAYLKLQWHHLSW